MQVTSPSRLTATSKTIVPLLCIRCAQRGVAIGLLSRSNLLMAGADKSQRFLITAIFVATCGEYQDRGARQNGDKGASNGRRRL
jgi:hypothetical protein